MNSDERRSSQRIALDYAVRVSDHQHPAVMGRLTSLSRSGCLVILPEPIAIGATVSIFLDDGEGTVTLRGQVVRIAGEVSPFGVGMMFGPLLPAAIAQVEALMHRNW